ncbi:MAG: hypothetical protein IK120_07820, partial [Muribaculaceae bacterium]|nr:hypothetical protein [Muribaculaceae bacterium]
CGVRWIDAVLMAKTVNTCGNSNNTNSSSNSNLLTIYGAVIANKLEANRTYGAATGANSIIPAEIIDFDPTLYLWKAIGGGDESGSNNDSDDSFNMEAVTQYELPPRL